MLVVISSLITTNCFANVNEKRSSEIIEFKEVKEVSAPYGR